MKKQRKIVSLRERKGDIMTCRTKEGRLISVKPIYATPSLSGKDAIDLINDIIKAPSDKVIKRNAHIVRTFDRLLSAQG